MSRQRLIWPSIWTDDDFMALSVGARLLFIGLFSTADDHGRGMGSPANLKAAIFPGDDNVTQADIAKWSAEIKGRGMARFYVTDGKSVFFDLPDWSRWQKPRYASASKVPAYQGGGSLRKACSENTSNSCKPAAHREEKRRGEESSDRDQALDRAQPPRATAPDTHRGHDTQGSFSGNQEPERRQPPRDQLAKVADFELLGRINARAARWRGG